MATQLNNMGAIIGWKHNHISGMRTENGIITDFPSGVDGVTYTGDIPSDANIATWKTEYEAHLASTEYARKRQVEYPSVGDQLDMLMKDMKNGTKTHQTACEAVKKKYKKP